jgi:hypothetical protein
MKDSTTAAEPQAPFTFRAEVEQVSRQGQRFENRICTQGWELRVYLQTDAPLTIGAAYDVTFTPREAGE